MNTFNALKKYHNRFFFLLAVVVFSLPFSEFITSLFILFIGVNFFTHAFWKTPLAIYYQPWLMVMLAFFLVQVIGVEITPSAYHPIAMKKLETKLPFVLVPVFFATGLQALTRKQLHYLVYVFALSVISMAFFCSGSAGYQVVQTGSWYSTWSNGSLRYYYFLYSGLSEVLMHPGYMSVFVGMGIFATHFWYRHTEKATAKKWLIAAMAFLVVYLVLLQGRINLLGFGFVTAIAGIVYGIQQRKQLRKQLFIVVGMVILGGVLFNFMPDGMKKRFTGLTDLSYDITAPTIHDFTGITIRLAEWECAREAIAKNGFWGSGQGISQLELQRVYVSKNFVVSKEMDLNAHNQLYETRLANGVIGLITLIALFVVWWIVGWQTKNYLLLLCSSFYFISFLTESMLERYYGVIVLCIVMPIIALLQTYPKAKSEELT